MIRKQILAKRESLSLAEQHDRSTKILSLLEGLPEIEKASTLFIYVNFRSEVQTVPFIKKCIAMGKTVAVPLTLVKEKKLKAFKITDPEKDLCPGYCGIPEPDSCLQQSALVDPSALEVAIIPGSVFDHRGGRLGYGGGYYDRFLVQAAPQAIRVALAYNLQLVSGLKLQPHDQLMDRIITEKNIYTCSRK